jgi:O-antigen/teichoic acid export membrane protein
MTGTISAQALGFLLMPVITRIYSPENFGIMTVYGAIITTIGVIACGCYEEAIILPKEEKEAMSVFFVSFLICVGVTMICFLIIGIFYKNLSRIFFNNESFIWLLVLPVGIYFFGLRLILIYWTTRKERFKVYSVSQFGQAIGNSGVKLLSGLIYGNKIAGLITGTICYSLFPCFFLGADTTRKDFRIFKKLPKKEDLLWVLKKYRNFPYFSSPTALLVNFARDIPIFFLAYLFDNQVVGAFGLANNAIRMPVGFIGNSVRQVFLQKTASLKANNKKVSRLMVKATAGLLSVGIIPFGTIFFFGQEIFEIVFGENWHIAGKYAEILSPWFFTMCINPPSRVIYTVLQKQKIYFFYTFIATISKAGVFIAGMIFNLNALSTLTYLSLSSAALNIWAIMYAYKLAVNYERNNRKVELMSSRIGYDQF